MGVLCLMPNLLRCCGCLLCCFFCTGSSSCTACYCVSLSAVLGFCSLFLYKLILAVYAGIACLAFPVCDWLPLHAGIACLAFLAFNWLTAWWDSLSRLLHAGIVCLVSLAYDWPIACWGSLCAYSIFGIACLVSLVCDWVISCWDPQLVDYVLVLLSLSMWTLISA